MICKYCGNEILDDSDICFVCNKVLKNKEEIINKTEDCKTDNKSDYYLMPSLFGGSVDSYKDVKRKFIINIVFIPILLFFLWFVFIYVNPIIAIIGAIIALVFGPSELKAQYKIIKDKRRRN